ncbi:nitrogen fixation protein NifU [Pilibacter termitis]|uniref:Nitrogen fixation protein NifU n=1 Tax=Pilibacter termitis TaxID=263852 RepID=A0A1T4KHX5_9ENTE|nr:SUF system NifU family Fe-S cluster assembly protein [Pilibacter termitis]SJZ42001.1 nitrogen fixation protein NifU [Pilibacter termitis]
MALSKLDNLYRAVILDHSHHPHHHGKLEGEIPLELSNPTCGDVIYLTLKIENNIITDIAFDGNGCSISTASASIMTDAVVGKTIEEINHLAEDFSLLVTGVEVENTKGKFGDGAMLAGVSKFPQRVKCATLSWNALKKALELNEKNR